MMRDKKRYLLVETSSGFSMSERDLASALYKEIIQCIGESDYHKVNPRLTKIIDDNKFIIKSSLEGTSKLVLAFALIKRLNGTETAFYTLKSSGTIRALIGRSA